jgi:hypothetical protein
MEEKLAKLLLEHWEIANKKTLKVICGKPNYLIKIQSGYLDPVIDEDTIVELKDKRGEREYFKRIRDDLKKLLNNEKVPYAPHFDGAPEEIKQLLIK